MSSSSQAECSRGFRSWIFNEDGSLKQVMVYRLGRLSDPQYSEKETEFLDELEKNRGKIKIPDISGNIIK